MLWHDLHAPFRVPFGLHGHKCTWQLFDDFLAGCSLCGRVHRCDFEVCEDITPHECGFREFKHQCDTFARCPVVQMEEDGSIICTITGIRLCLLDLFQNNSVTFIKKN
jgi:hypothetical protein